MSSLQVAIAAFKFVHHKLSWRRKRREIRWWLSELCRARSVYSGTNLSADLRFVEVSGQYKNFTRVTAADFELLINLFCPKILKMDTRFWAAVPVQGRLAVTLRFLATGDSYSSLQYLFQISKQSVCTWGVSSYCWGTDGKHTGKKIVYCAEQSILHIKLMDWNTETRYVSNKVLLITSF
jgi:hypothetical protein